MVEEQRGRLRRDCVVFSGYRSKRTKTEVGDRKKHLVSINQL
jgi:hypothetical protein